MLHSHTPTQHSMGLKTSQKNFHEPQTHGKILIYIYILQDEIKILGEMEKN